MTDLDLPYTLPDGTLVHIMYETISPTTPFISGIFNQRTDAEIDYHTLPLEVKEDILSKCREAVQKRKQEQQ